VCIDCSRRFFMNISLKYIPCRNRINPLYYILFLYLSALILYSSLWCITLYYLHTHMYCVSILFALYYSLFLSCLPVVPSDPPTKRIMFRPNTGSYFSRLHWNSQCVISNYWLTIKWEVGLQLQLTSGFVSVCDW
jgi:hypothetical protein